MIQKGPATVILSVFSFFFFGGGGGGGGGGGRGIEIFRISIIISLPATSRRTCNQLVASGGGNRSSQRKQPRDHKSLPTNSRVKREIQF